MQASVINKQQKKVEAIELNEAIFSTKPMPYLWHEMVKWQLAKKRQGTAKTMHRGEVSGTTKKMYRQKGTGRARHGSAKAPIFVGGGQTFGPIPRSYEYNLPKKMKKQALCSVLSAKLKEEQIKIVDQLDLDERKTKKALAMLEPFGLKSALVIDEQNETLSRAVRNLRNYKFVRPQGLNMYDLIKFEGLIITKGALNTIQENLSA